MMNIAIIDLDGVLANNEARFALAKEPDGRINWDIMFDPALVVLDTVIDGAIEAIADLELNYLIVYLTSRPEHMRLATYSWLDANFLAGPRLVMKPESEKYTKTTKWKANEVKALALEYLASDILFVDDEQNNIAEVAALRIPVTCKTSLVETQVETWRCDKHGDEPCNCPIII